MKAETLFKGKYYYDNLKQAMITVIDENQGMINTNPDGSVKNQNLTPANYFKLIHEQFVKSGVGKNFSMKNFAGETNPEIIAPVLTALMEAGRVVTANLQGSINQEADGTIQMKKFIPAGFGRIVLEKFSEKTNADMKQTTLGKGQYQARNYWNRPNAWETKALTALSDPGWERGKGYSIYEGREFHFVHSLYVKESCMPCHAEPIDSVDPYGHPREGYLLDELRGGISLSLPLK
jgi:hypothetical protein